MELTLSLLVALPIGYLIRERLAAYLAYVAAHSFVFGFQNLQLTREWVGGSTHAFPKNPDSTPGGTGS